MKRQSETDDLETFARRVVGLLDEHQIDYAIGGSLAAMEYSEPRLSIDVDIMVLVEPDALARFVASLESWGVYVTPLEVILGETIPRATHFNIIDGASGSKADIYPVLPEGLAGSAMQRRRSRVWESASRDVVWFLAPEDVILFKLVHYRAGGEVARKHPEDIARILQVMASDLDSNYIESWAQELDVLDLWRALARRGGA